MRTIVGLAFVMLFFDKVQAVSSGQNLVKDVNDVMGTDYKDATSEAVRSSTDSGDSTNADDINNYVLPENWVVNDKWPQCADTFDFVGNTRIKQGVSVCNNTWAFVGLKVLNSHMCIAGMRGVKSSVAFTTTCNFLPGHDPCVEGEGTMGSPFMIELLTAMVPQIKEPPVAQCYDYTPSMNLSGGCPDILECNQQEWSDKFPEGVFDDARVKWQQRIFDDKNAMLMKDYWINAGPPAPGSNALCVPLSLYYTTFRHDDSNPDSPSPEIEQKMQQLRVYMYINGPVFTPIHKHTSLQTYTAADGVYSHESVCSQMPDYWVVVQGWGNDDGKDYWLIQNTWGEDWGIRGSVKVQPCAIPGWGGPLTLSLEPHTLIIEESEIERVENMMAIYNPSSPASSETEEDGTLVAIAPPRASFAAGVLLAIAAVP